VTYELDENIQQEITAGQIEELKERVFLNELKLVKWAAMEGDWNNQITQGQRAIANDRAVIYALSAL
jgi:hypothetical protein